MFDLCRDCTYTILKKLSRTYLSAESYFEILIFILSNYRFSVIFCKRINDLIERLHARDTITPSLAGDEAI